MPVLLSVLSSFEHLFPVAAVVDSSLVLMVVLPFSRAVASAPSSSRVSRGLPPTTARSRSLARNSYTNSTTPRVLVCWCGIDRGVYLQQAAAANTPRIPHTAKAIASPMFWCSSRAARVYAAYHDGELESGTHSLDINPLIKDCWPTHLNLGLTLVWPDERQINVHIRLLAIQLSTINSQLVYYPPSARWILYFKPKCQHRQM